MDGNLVTSHALEIIEDDWLPPSLSSVNAFANPFRLQTESCSDKILVCSVWIKEIE